MLRRATPAWLLFADITPRLFSITIDAADAALFSVVLLFFQAGYFQIAIIRPHYFRLFSRR
jgi:hypothetical protein